MATAENGPFHMEKKLGHSHKYHHYHHHHPTSSRPRPQVSSLTVMFAAHLKLMICILDASR